MFLGDIIEALIPKLLFACEVVAACIVFAILIFGLNIFALIISII